MLRFISQRLQKGHKGSFSSIVSAISIVSIAFGVMVLILSFNILEGFKSTVLTRLFSVEGHIKVSGYDANQYIEMMPVKQQSNLYLKQGEIEGVSHIQSFINKSALIKTEDQVEGVLVKGVDEDFNFDIFQKNMVQGQFIEFNDSTTSGDAVISQSLANRLKLNVGDDLFLFFIQERPKERKLKISGIYNTYIEDFDKKVVLCDLNLIQKLNKWGDTLIGGYDVFVSDFSQLEETSAGVYEKMDYDLQLEKITNRFPHIFDWLELLNTNVLIFIIIIFVIAGFNMLSTIYILIMERANMIGVFQSFGARTAQIRGVFWFHGVLLTLKGMLIGNALGLGFCAIQYFFHALTLDPESYYMSYVPIKWDWLSLALINVGVFILINGIILLPTYLVSRLQPIKVIKFS